MANQTDSAANSNLLMAYFERKALEVLHDQVAFYQLADKKPLPKGSGESMTFNGWRKIAPASSNLSEYSASANVAVRLSSRKVTATIASYGRAIEITEFLDLTSVLPVEPGALAELEDSAARTVDNIIQFAALKDKFLHTGNENRCTSAILSAFMSAAASSWCANTGTTGQARRFAFPVVFGTSCVKLSSTHAASAGVASMSAMMGPIAVRKAVNRLRRLNVKPFANGKYAGIIHPNAVGTMLANPDYKAWLQNWAGGSTSTMYKHKVAEVHNVEFIESANMPRFNGITSLSGSTRGKLLNISFICGQGALAVSELDGGIKFILHKPEQTGNTFELYSTLAFKVRAAGAVLNPSCGVVLITQDMAAEVKAM